MVCRARLELQPGVHKQVAILGEPLALQGQVTPKAGGKASQKQRGEEREHDNGN